MKFIKILRVSVMTLVLCNKTYGLMGHPLPDNGNLAEIINALKYNIPYEPISKKPLETYYFQYKKNETTLFTTKEDSINYAKEEAEMDILIQNIKVYNYSDPPSRHTCIGLSYKPGLAHLWEIEMKIANKIDVQISDLPIIETHDKVFAKTYNEHILAYLIKREKTRIFVEGIVDSLLF